MKINEQLTGLLESAGIAPDDITAVIETFDEVIAESHKVNDELTEQLTAKDAVISGLKEYIGNQFNKRNANVSSLLQTALKENTALKIERDTLLEYTDSAVADIKQQYKSEIEQRRQSNGIAYLVENFIESVIAIKPELTEGKIEKLKADIDTKEQELAEAINLINKADEKIALLESASKKDELSALIEAKIDGLSTFKKSKIRVLAKKSGIVDANEMNAFLTEAVTSVSAKSEDLDVLTESINGEPAKRNKTVRHDDKYVNMLKG
jgi:hypothetical protein